MSQIRVLIPIYVADQKAANILIENLTLSMSIVNALVQEVNGRKLTLHISSTLHLMMSLLPFFHNAGQVSRIKPDVLNFFSILKTDEYDDVANF